jgi:succinate-semialdehyde dehydrogenase / glutarate-semialdehyde dehydrogenase
MSLIRSIDPWTGAVLKEFSGHSLQEVETCLSLAEQTFSSWRELPIPEKARLMRRVAGLLLEKKEPLARIISQEVGKVIRESRAEIEKCAWVCDFYAENAASFLTPGEILLPDSKRAQVIFQPLGIILGVMPWNFPFWQVFRFAVPTLLAGNVALLKHASNVPNCALAIQDIFEAAGLPKGCFQTLLISGTEANALLADSRVQAVSLTGSEQAGAAIASTAGKHIKKSLLELGGSDPFIVLADADLPKAAAAAVKSRMINFGQSCIAAKRFIIEEGVFDEFVRLFLENLSALKFGSPLEESSDYACMARADLAAELYAQVSKTVAMGAKVLWGGTAPEPNSARLEPTVLTDIPVGSPAYQEELFGPVASIFKVASGAEAIALANATEFGLGASLWTADLAHGADLATHLESGAVFLNSLVASHPMLPFGGIKKSGYGRELSRQGILEFVNQKTIYLG